MSASFQVTDSEVSIILLTFNGEKYLSQVLEMIHRQKVKPLEILAIDSGSSDRTPDILRAHPVQLHQIPNEEFSHPKTRNCGVRLARGKYVVFLTQDATPADSCWLDRLLAPFQETPNVAGVFSRQIPRPGSDLLDANDLHMYFKAKRQVRSLNPEPDSHPNKIWEYIQFSNASAIYDRELVLQNPFDETLAMAEDQEWAKRILEQGYSIVYEPESIVLHSHNHTLAQKYQRSLKMGSSFAQFLSPLFGRRRFPLIAWLYHIFSDLFYLGGAAVPWGEKLKWLSRSPLHRATIHYAYYKGWNSAVTRIQRSVVAEGIP